MKASLRLVVLVTTLLILVTACSPVVQTSPAAYPSSTPVPFQSDATATLAQLTSTPAVETPVVTPTFQLSSACVLTSEQRSRLETVSRKYLADSELDALHVAQDLNYIGINGQPSTMCGPLAVAILQDAGLVDPYYPRKNFYLLNPRPGFGDGFVESLFPSSRYTRIVEERVIKEVDYKAEPLCPGDFLYLFAGESGSYEHMLVVTRVDEAGRAYTVTNLDFRLGYRVVEVMLYDPAQPGVGMFTDWTSQPHPQVGRTGYGGFWLWRPKSPIPDPSPAAVGLIDSINRIIEETGGQWHMQLKEVGGSTIYSRLADSPINPSSVNHLADAVLFLNLLENKAIGDLPAYLRDNGIDSRSFDQLLRAMLIKSEESAADSIENRISQDIDPNVAIQEMGFKNTLITSRRSTTAELSAMLEQLYLGSLLSEESRTYLQSLLAERSPSEETLTGVIRSRLSDSDMLVNIPGSPVSYPVIAADLALLELNGKAYTLAFFASPAEGSGSPGAAQLESAIEEISILFYEYLQSQ